MDYAKEMQHDRQFLQSQMKSEAFHSNHQRRSANYKPNIWNYDFLQSLNSIYNEEKYKRKAEELKEDVKHMFVEAVYQLAKLELIDSIRKLGLANYFEEEIKDALDTIASAKNKNQNPIVQEDLYATALCFRLLRLHGYEVSQDMFSGFTNEKGAFIRSKCANTKGMLELFEASHLALENENNLDEAKDFSTAHLKGIDSNSDINLAKQVAHSLGLPLHWRVQWFSVRWHINAYEKEGSVNAKLLDLAKLNFNIIQATHQKDLQEVSRWWRNFGLIENLHFARDRLVESFMCALGLVSDPQYRSFRKWLTKVIIMILIIDDVYDVYGSLEELHHFTNAIDRWDFKEIQQLPECMKICFQALDNITDDIAYEIQKEKDRDRNQVLPHLKKVWGDFCKALFVEAKWYNMGYKPSLQEYISNAWISSAGPVILLHAFFAVTQEATKETVDFLGKNQDLIYNSSLVIRLCNDLGTSMAEKERGDVPSSILCYMRDVNVSEDIAQEHIKGIILKTMMKMNEQFTSHSPLLQLFVSLTTNAARVAHILYQYEDGFGVQDRKTRDRILSLLVEPLILNR